MMTKYNTDNNNARPVVGIDSMLLVAFVVLKLCGVIDWSWWWVLAPLWMPIALVLVIFFIAFIVLVLKGD